MTVEKQKTDEAAVADELGTAIGGEDGADVQDVVEGAAEELVADAGEEDAAEETDTTEADEIANFRALFGGDELEEADQKPAPMVQQKQDTAAPTYSGYKDLSKHEFDEAMESPEAFNKMRKNDYHSAVMEGVQHAVSYMSQTLEARLKVHSIVTEFYDTYKDLKSHKPLVKAAIEEVRAQKPKAPLAEVLVTAARATRAYVANKNGNGTTKKKSTTQQLPNKSARQPTKKVAPDSREARLKAFVSRHVGARS